MSTRPALTVSQAAMQSSNIAQFGFLRFHGCRLCRPRRAGGTASVAGAGEVGPGSSAPGKGACRGRVWEMFALVVCQSLTRCS